MTRSLSNLKKTILIATSALTVVSASAQRKAEVNVPFAFEANQVSLPAGHYQVLVSGTSLAFINMNNRETQAMLLTRNEQANAIAETGRLRFHNAGNRYLLTEVQFAGSSIYSELLRQPKKERHVASNTHEGRTVEIAMK